MDTGAAHKTETDAALLDRVALALLVLSIAVAIFYPETFISDPPRIVSQSFVPLNLLLPFFGIFFVIYFALRRNLVKPDAVDLALGLFMLYLLARNITGPEAAGVVKYVVYGTGLFYITALITTKKKLLEMLIWSLLAIAVVVVLYSLVEYAVQTNPLYQDAVSQVIPEPVRMVHRAGSTIAHPVANGAYMVMMLPFTLLIWFESSRQLYRTIGITISLLTVVALILTYSKGSWLVAGILGVFFLTMVLLKRKKASKKPLLYIFIVLVFAGIIFGQQMVSELLLRTDISVGQRLFAWHAALGGIGENPVVGVGYRQGSAYLLSTEDGQEYFVWAKRPMAVDNNYLNLLLEGGVIALLLWLAFLVLVFYKGISAIGRGGGVKGWVIAAFFSAAALSLNAVTFEAWLVWPTFMLFMVMAGMIRGWNISEQAATRPVTSQATE